MKPFSKILDNDNNIKNAKNALDKGNDIAFKYCNHIVLSHIVASLHKKQALIVTDSDADAAMLYDSLLSYNENTFMLKEKDVFFDNLSLRSTENITNRLQALSKLAYNEDLILIAPISALADRYKEPSSFYDNIIRLRQGDYINRDKLENSLIRLGYERAALTTIKGQYSVRGEIVDIYPMNSLSPIRIDFFDEEIERISLFDTETQRSEKEIASVSVLAYQITEFDDVEGFDDAQLSATLMDYFDKAAYLYLFDVERIEEGLDHFYKEVALRGIKALDKDRLITVLSNREKIFVSRLEIDGRTRFLNTAINIEEKLIFHIDFSSVVGYKSRIGMFFDKVKDYVKNGYSVSVYINNEKKAKRIAEELNKDGLNAYFSADNGLPSKNQVAFYNAYLSDGIEYKDLKAVIITDNDIFGRRARRKNSSNGKFKPIASFFDLKVGDLVIHEDNGLGRYLGVEKIELEGVTKDYLKIEYADEAMLYVPTIKMDRLQKYAAKDNVGSNVRLDDLDGKRWKRTKKKVEENVKEVAEKLIKLYAIRSEKQGYACSVDTVWQREFEEAFEYEETPSQITAINDVKRDMQSGKVMDRLICGDVGFGKTEIAIRAAFKAVQENKQVAYLVPTTVLAVQHYKNFKNRLESYPVNVDLMCRFRTRGEQKKTIEKIKNGSCDIVIGTHRLLSKDISFKDLGLLIVDEEQRFGVAHKEKIKELKENIDVLTLTATPIPRTLNMSMIGVRDISILKEAPSNRLPINTYATAFDEAIVAMAIKRELAREGQVFFVYNRVNTIADMADKLSSLVPEAIIAYAHGQMSPRELESIMYEFENRKIDVLVSTTIIETGIDMPNVNTMIIADAGRLGLSSLYQLRGRIGRGDRSSYAYLLYPRGVALKEDASKRLSSIIEFSSLGSGYKIAMKDLEIRGEGNIFGFQQSGHIGAVGYELYCKMLKRALAELKNEVNTEDLYTTSIDCPINAHIPTDYVEDEQSRMSLYRKIAMIETAKDKTMIEEELLDRFGSIPNSTANLIRVAELKARANRAYITVIKNTDAGIIFMLYDRARLNVGKIEHMMLEYNLQLALKEEPDNPKLSGEGRYNYRHKYYGVLSLVNGKDTYFNHKLSDNIRDDNKTLEIIEKVIDYVSELVIE